MVTIGETTNVREQSKKKNEARGKCLIRKTRTNLDIYQQKRTKANGICRRKKRMDRKEN
jgi:hypothetical protein